MEPSKNCHKLSRRAFRLCFLTNNPSRHKELLILTGCCFWNFRRISLKAHKFSYLDDEESLYGQIYILISLIQAPTWERRKAFLNSVCSQEHTNNGSVSGVSEHISVTHNLHCTATLSFFNVYNEQLCVSIYWRYSLNLSQSNTSLNVQLVQGVKLSCITIIRKWRCNHMKEELKYTLHVVRTYMLWTAVVKNW